MLQLGKEREEREREGRKTAKVQTKRREAGVGWAERLAVPISSRPVHTSRHLPYARRAIVCGGHQLLWTDRRSLSRGCGQLRSCSFFFPFPLIFSFIRGSISPRRIPRSSRARRSDRIRDAIFDMAAFDLPCSPLLLLVLFVAALTSSVSVVADGASSVPLAPGRDPSSEPPPSLTVETSDATGEKKIVQYEAEGGPISMSTSTTQHESIKDVVKTESNEPSESKARENVPKERYASPSVVARKGVNEEKIKPRKGVDQNMDPGKENISINQSTPENMKSIAENSPVIETHIKLDNSYISNPKLNATNPHDSLNRNINSNYSNASLVAANLTTSHPETMNIAPNASSHTEKHIPKPKPTVTTVDGPEVNESIPPSRTKNPPLGMPRKIDYIVPVIITIVAVPILGAAIFVLYRRGRDCWDKRHYRRMDFLIDGMYND